MIRTFAVTGVASGIGAVLAVRLRAKGHRVIGLDVCEPPGNVDRFVRIDLDSPASIDAAIGEFDETLHGLCCNAGLPPRDGMETSILHVNFTGHKRLALGLLPRLANGSSIVNMASRMGDLWCDNLDQIKRFVAIGDRDALDAFVGKEGIDAARAYELSKEAMIVWTMAMTEELIGRRVRINSISPSAVDTNIFDDFANVYGDIMWPNIDRAGGPAHPGEIASVAAFLLSRESSWVNGANIPVDGGIGGFNLADAFDLDAMKGLL